MKHTNWIPDGNGNEFALIRTDDGVGLVGRPSGDETYTPEDPEVHILHLDVSHGVYLAGSNAISPYPMTENGAIQVSTDDLKGQRPRVRIL